eukprot:s1099_g17.t1
MTTPSVRRCRPTSMRAVASGALLAMVSMVLVLGSGGRGGKDIESLEFQQKQAPVDQFQLGGTLVRGGGCPAVCGEFVECALDRRSRQNLMNLEYFANLQTLQGMGIPFSVGFAYDKANGFVNLYPSFSAFPKLIRLANKQVVPRTQDFQCPNSSCWIPRGFVNDDYCDCPGSCADEEFHSCDECGVGLTSSTSLSVNPATCPDLRCRDTTAGVVRQPCLGPGVVTDPFVCPDNGGTPGCTINKSLVDNNVKLLRGISPYL